MEKSKYIYSKVMEGYGIIFKRFYRSAVMILTFITYLLGGYDGLLEAMLIVMVIDYLTGVASAFYNKTVSSKTGLRGIIKKISYLSAVALSVVIDNLLGQSGAIRTIVIYSFVANDGISIIENLARMNIKLPNVLLASLEQINNVAEEKSTDIKFENILEKGE